MRGGRDCSSALGQHIKLGGPYMQWGPVLEIVGVVANVPQMGIGQPAPA